MVQVEVADELEAWIVALAEGLRCQLTLNQLHYYLSLLLAQVIYLLQ